MTEKIFDVVVISYDPSKMKATAVDLNKVGDAVEYEIFAPAHFGGHDNPYPEVGEILRIRYGRIRNGGSGKRIIECWRPEETLR